MEALEGRDRPRKLCTGRCWWRNHRVRTGDGRRSQAIHRRLPPVQGWTAGVAFPRLPCTAATRVPVRSDCRRRHAMGQDDSPMIRSTRGIDVPTTLPEWCDPRSCAFIVYDMQVGICRQVKGAEAVIERTAAALESARSVGMRVAFTRHISLPRVWMGMTQLRTAMTWQRTDDPDAVEPWFDRQAEATAIVPELAPGDDEAVFDKLTMSAFDSSALGFALHDCGLRAIAVAGIALEIGIEPTVRQATDNGFAAIVLSDACGFGNQEARDRSLATLSFLGEAIITDTASFCAALSRSP